ncbi:21354_t:CDS:2, partial [Gigaspora rosea]
KNIKKHQERKFGEWNKWTKLTDQIEGIGKYHKEFTNGQLIILPVQTIVLIEFLQPSEARNAFTNLAYKKFKGVPLYLEKAPLGVFKSEVDPSSNQIDDDARKVPSSSGIIENAINEEEESSEVTAT